MALGRLTRRGAVVSNVPDSNNSAAALA